MFKLYASVTSPFARKVLIVAHETGTIGRIEVVPTNVWAEDSAIGDYNPLGKIPALALDDGVVLFDSRVICEYLDGLHEGPRLFPAAPEARWRCLRQQAMGDGLCDAAVACVVEGRRPEAVRWPAWIERQQRAVVRTLDRLEHEVDALEPEGWPTIGSLSVLTGVGYVGFRLPELAWQEGRPRLAHWFARCEQRPCFQATRPPA